MLCCLNQPLGIITANRATVAPSTNQPVSLDAVLREQLQPV